MLVPQKIALVTGANSDVGLPLTKCLLELGYRVIAHYHSSPSVLSSMASPNIRTVQADLTLPEDAERLVQIASEYGRGVDLLINVVGPFDHRFLFEFTPSDWNQSIQLNLNTAFNMVYYARPYLIQAKGHVINFTYAGVENIRALPMATAYAAAKSGVAVLTKSMAAAFADSGVRVNAIAPSWIDHSSFTDEKRNAISSTIPVGRLGTSDEVIDVIKWLIIDSPFYTTGSTLTIGGAWEF